MTQSKDNSDNTKSQGPTSSWILNYLINLMNSGALAVMPGNTNKILDVLLIHRVKDHQRFPLGTKRIMKESGVKGRNTFFRSVRQLDAAGLLGKRTRAAGGFHYINLWDIPLDPAIDVMGLNAELNLQKKERTTVSKNGTVVNGKERKTATVSKGGTHTIVSKGGTHTTVSKGGTHKHLNHIKQKEKKESKKESGKKTPSNKKYKISPEILDEVVDKVLKTPGQRSNKKKMGLRLQLECGEKTFKDLKKDLKK